MYEVEYADGSKQAIAANVIAENMFASVDEEGHRHLLLDSIIDTHKYGVQMPKTVKLHRTTSKRARQKKTNLSSGID